MSDPLDFYALLGVNYDATGDEIRNAYFDAARLFHPDVNPETWAREQFLRVQSAYETLSDPQKRFEYDSHQPPRQLSSISVKIQYSRSRIPVLDEPQLVYALLEYASTSEPDPLSQPPISLCLVLDRSTSMRGERMDMVKGNVFNLLRKLSPRDLISVVAYSDRAEVILPPTRVNESEKIIERVSLLEPNGGTEIYQGLSAGYDLLKSSRLTEEFRHLFLLTDGHTYGDEKACFRLASQAAADGIIIHGLGIGTEWDDEFLDRLTGLSGGSTIYVSNQEDLIRVLEKKIYSIGLVYARSLKLDFQTLPGVKLNYAIRLLPEVSPVPTDSPLILGNLQYGRRQTLLLEFLLSEVNNRESVFELLNGRLSMYIPSERVSLEQKICMRRSVTRDAFSELPPAEIVEALSRLTLYRIHEKARSEVDDGQFFEASRHLQNLATHLLAQGERELAHAVLKEAEHIQQTNRFTSDGDKKIKYGTRQLMLPAGMEN